MSELEMWIDDDIRACNHVTFKPEDFTEEEVSRKNSLAVVVIEQGRDVCKHCGRVGAVLEAEVCRAREQR